MARGFHRETPGTGSRYTRYSGGDPLAPPVDLAEALEHIGREVMDGTSAERAMREFLRRGGRGRDGLDDLARKVAERRRELLRRHSLDGTMQELTQLLERAVLAERGQLARDTDMDDDARAFHEMRLESLPASPASALRELGDYDWQSPAARADYEKARDLIGRELLDQRFAGMKRALEGATDEDRADIARMLEDLNALLDKHRRGEDTQDDFERFMQEHGEYFPDDPQDVDELMDALARRSAAAQRTLNSMTQEQRDELMQLSAQAFGSPALMEALGRLDQNLRAMRPGMDWSGSERFDGDDPLGLGEAVGVMEEIGDLDQLADQLAQSYPGARMDDVDLDEVSRLLGEEAAVSARTLADLERELRDSGMLHRTSDGTMRLSPRAMRQLGQSLLKDVATRLSGRDGRRDTRAVGAAGELTGATREWEFGDTGAWDIPRTVTNAITRAAASGAPGQSVGPVHLEIGDVEIVETEARTQSAVALLVDTSFSMAMAGRWLPMKRTALALHHLIHSRFRGDHLELIAFARHAQTMDVDELTGLDAEWDKGTNLQHALMLAARHFRRHPNAQPVLLVVTDGEPTSHLEPDGSVFFSYPPHPVTIAATVRELDTMRRMGAQTTFFRLGDDPGLARFTDQLAQRVDGRVVAPELDDLGAAVVGSYLGMRGSGGSGAGSSGSGGGSGYGGWGGDDWSGFGGRRFWVG